MKTYTIEQIEAEMAEIDKKLEDYQALLDRRGTLAQIRLLTIKLRRLEGHPEPNGARTLIGAPEPKSAVLASALTHSHYLEMALKKNGPLPIGELLTAVRAEGWQGSGEDAIDKRRLYVPLYREKEKFKLGSNGKWSLIQTASA